MKEFMFFIRKQSDSMLTLSPERHQQFLKGCETYIAKLKKEGKLASCKEVNCHYSVYSTTKVASLPLQPQRIMHVT